MSDRISNDSNDQAKSLIDIGDDYLELIGATQEIWIQIENTKLGNWTGVVSTAYFAAAGCIVNNLGEDVADAWAEIDSLRSGEAWQFMFDAKDYELSNDETDID